MKTEERMTETRRASPVGLAVFLATLAAVLVFFWWLLIYDHGAPIAP